MSEIDLLPRADLPVIWDAFKAEAEIMRNLTETIAVTDVSQEKEMALARKTRLTLRGIRIAVEHKRVELGEGHLKEIQRVNGAAKAIREFIEPLEARLLVQESFAERAEEKRIAELTRCRNAEIDSIRLGAGGSNTGQLTQADYDVYIARLRAEKAEIEAANRLRVEAESRLAAQKLEMELREVAIRAEAAKLMLAQQLEAKAEQDRQNAIAEAKALEVYADLKRKNEAEHAIRVIEALRLDNERAVRDADLAEQKRIRDEQFAKLEAELAQERAAKQAEADAARKLALAPDAAKLIAYVDAVRSAPIPVLHSKEATIIFNKVALAIASACGELRLFCN